MILVYHKPDDRPTLQELLAEAEEYSQADFPGETDDYVRDWIQYWFFDVDPSDNRDDPGGGGRGKGGGGGDNNNNNNRNGLRQSQVAQNPVDRLQTIFERQFPRGVQIIANNGNDLRCGLLALVDSFRAQLGINPFINGVLRNVVLPTVDDLLDLHEDLIARGDFGDFLADDQDDILEDSNFNVTALGAILVEWARLNNLE
jgi:hypothetical protein